MAERANDHCERNAEVIGDEPLRRLLEISRRLGGSSELTVILEVIIDALRDLLDAERASVFTLDAATQELVIHIAHGVGGAGAREVRIPASAGIAGACVASRSIVNVPDAYLDPRFSAEMDSRTGYRTRSILAVPLLDHDGALVGVAQVLNRRGGPFTKRDERVAEGIAAQAAVALRRAHFIADHLAKVALEREMIVAREIQESSFPKSIPASASFDISCHTTPATHCAGDAIDIFGLRDGALVGEGELADSAALLIADATGHGVGPAISSMQVRSMFRLALRVGLGLHTCARTINDQLSDDLPAAHFVTAWLGILDFGSGKVECFSAGQGPVFVYRRASDSFEDLGTIAPPLGMPIPGAFDETARSVQLHPGDILLLLTDGYYEAMDPQRTMWGHDEIHALVRSHRDGSMRLLREALDRAVLEFARTPGTADDRTALIVKRLA